MRTCGIVPARHGSKRMTGKNVTPLMGLPLSAWTMRAARNSDLDLVFVSTDCPDVVEVASREGIPIIHRPDEYCTDTASTESVLLHACEVLGLEDTDTIVCLQPTSPLRSSERINEALRMMRDPRVDSVVSVVRHPLTAFAGYVGPDGSWEMAYDPMNRPRTQDAVWHHENGAIFCTRVGLLRATGCRMSGDIRALVMQEWESVDIDCADQIAIAEMWLTKQLFRRTSPQLRDAGWRE